METSVIGYPRIGTLRELKFTLEKYFRKEIEKEELLQKAAELRKSHWEVQKKAGIGYIPGNDFSFYDKVLDTAVLFGIIPKRYRELNLPQPDTYFAMARGYQGEAGDVKALAMKKWFHTNYHYIVPELEDDIVPQLSGTKLFDEYEEAKASGIETKPVIVGAYTMLKLCRYTGSKSAADYADAMAAAYQELVRKCEEQGVIWIQFDEPALVWDMDADDIALFTKVYDAILSSADKTKILLQTYFGDVRDIYQKLTEMPFDAIGLDFIEGKMTGELIRKYGFPKEKLLFAGLVSGKNIWRNHYQKTLDRIHALQAQGIRVVLSTSCSLQHVPYTLRHETHLPEEALAHFAFAEEKLTELQEIAVLAEFPTTTIGSFPQTRDEVLDLEANGIRMIQIDEAALREKLPLRKSDWYTEYLDFAIPAFRLTHSGVKPETQIHTHMCYSEFTDIIPAIDDMDADVITFEASRSDLQILDSLRENGFETEVGPGVYDIHSPRVPSAEEMEAALDLMLTKIPKEKLWVNPDCGLKTRGVTETDASLRNMAEAAKRIREKY